MRKHVRKLIIILLVGVIGFTYLYKLTEIPDSFSNDEAIFGYNAYSLLQTGRDEYGKLLPIISESNGDFKLLLLSYWLIPFVKIFGLNEFAVRLGQVIATFAVLTIVFLLVKKISGNVKLGLLTLFLLSLSPWFIIFGRSACETMISMFFFYLSMYLFLNWDENRKFIWFFLGIVSGTISAIGYYSVWFILMIVLLMVFVRSFFVRKNVSSFIVTAALVIIPMVIVATALMASGSARMKQINLLKNSNVQALLEEQIREDQQSLPYTVTRGFHNKIAFYPYFVARQFIQTFNVDFLFFSGDTAGTLYVVPYTGVFYLWYLPFLFLGLYYFFRYWRISYQKLVVPLLIVAIFFAGSLSVYGSPSQRTIMAAPLLCLIIAYGIYKSHKLFSTYVVYKASIVIGLLLVIFQTGSFLHQYSTHANVHLPWFRNYGDKYMIQAVNHLQKKYQKVVAPETSYSAFYFYNKVDPKIAQANSQQRQDIKNGLGHLIRKEANGIILMPIDCPVAGKLKVLYVCSGTNIPQNARIVEEIRYRDGQPAYTLLEFSETPLVQPPNNLHFFEKSSILSENDQRYWLDATEVE